jgi:hypothetical protein
VLAREHAALAHARVTRDHLLHLLAEELHPGHVDPVVAAAGEEQHAVGVEIALVARAEAVLRDERRRGRPRREVGVEQARAADADLARAVGRARSEQRLARVVAQPHVVGGERPAERGGLALRRVCVQHRQPDLDDPERLRERDAEARAEAGRELRAQPLGGGDREAQVEAGSRRVLREQRVVERRRVRDRRALARGKFEYRTGQRAGRQQDRRAESQVEQDRHHEMVCHRQQPQDPITGPDRECLVRGGQALRDPRVREHHALARARGARSEAQIGGIQRAERGLLAQRPAERVVGEPVLLRDQTVEPRGLGEALARGASGVVGDRHEAATRGEDRERALDEARALARDQPAARAAREPRVAQARRLGVEARDELAVGDRVRLAAAIAAQRGMRRARARVRPDRIEHGAPGRGHGSG